MVEAAHELDELWEAPDVEDVEVDLVAADGGAGRLRWKPLDESPLAAGARLNCSVKSRASSSSPPRRWVTSVRAGPRLTTASSLGGVAWATALRADEP